MKNTLKEISSYNGQVIITGHVNPDFDSLASCALINYLCKKGGVIVENTINSESIDKTFNYFNNICGQSINWISEVNNPSKSILVMVDICSNNTRLPMSVVDNLDKFEKIYIIDHHIKNVEVINALKEINSNYNYCINSQEKSCAEYIYANLNNKLQNNKYCKELYTFGVLGDTHNCKFGEPNYSIDQDLARRLRDEWFILNDKEAILLACISASLFTNQYYFVDFEIFNQIKNHISFSKLACYLSFALDDIAWDLTIEVEPNIFQHYLRAGNKSDIDVSEIARKNGGGGHKKASGVRNSSKDSLI